MSDAVSLPSMHSSLLLTSIPLPCQPFRDRGRKQTIKILLWITLSRTNPFSLALTDYYTRTCILTTGFPSSSRNKSSSSSEGPYLLFAQIDLLRYQGWTVGRTEGRWRVDGLDRGHCERQSGYRPCLPRHHAGKEHRRGFSDGGCEDRVSHL